MKISKRDQGMLLILLGLVILIAAYFGVYKNFIDKADELSVENNGLQDRVRELEEHYKNISVYQDGIKEISESVEKDIASFPSDVRSEDLIVYGNRLEEELDVSVSDMSFSQPELVSQFSIPEQGENEATVFQPYAALRTDMSVSVEMSYEQMLEFVDYIYKKSDHTTLESISVGYDSKSGKLNGTVYLSKYFMSGSNYKYMPTELPNYKQGTENPFGTINVTTEKGTSGTTSPGTTSPGTTTSYK